MSTRQTLAAAIVLSLSFGFLGGSATAETIETEMAVTQTAVAQAAMPQAAVAASTLAPSIAAPQLGVLQTGASQAIWAQAALAGVSAAGVGDHYHSDDCVIDHRSLLSGMFAAADSGKGVGPLGAGTRVGDIFILPFQYDGVYDRDDAGAPNVAARQWVTRSFLAANPDRFDFVLVFTNFAWDAGEARGLYWSIANDVEGIGVDVFDLSSEFGSEVIEGYIDGMLLSDYQLPDGSLDKRRVKEIINHELGHRWLVHPSVDEGSGPTDALLGRDGSHWSYLYGVDDFMYGSEWTANGDGTFTATSVRQRFSPLSLYLMGMMPASEVPPFSLLDNPDIDVTQIPMLGATISATERTLTVDDVIRAEGSRFPNDVDSRHEFRVGMIYLTDPGMPYNNQDLDVLNDLREFWQESFFRHTHGRGVVQVVEQGELPPGGGTINLPLALEWLSQDSGGGLWGDSATTRLRDSAEAMDALGRAGGYFSVVEDAVRLLEDQTAGVSGLRYRKLEAMASYSSDDPGLVSDLADQAEAEQGADGGWSAYPRYATDAVTTARAVRALNAVGRPASSTSGWQGLVDRQNLDGGWSWQPGQPSSVAVTLEVLLAARAIDELGFWALPEVEAGVAWLLSRRVDGGYGDLYPNIAETALFLQLVLDQSIDQGFVQGAIGFLAAHQELDGSWESSAYKTAVAVKGLIAHLLPDPYVDQAEAFALPEQPFDGEDARLIAAIRNAGVTLAAGTEYEWQAYRADETLIWGQRGTLPTLGEAGFTTIDDLLPGGELPPGEYTLRLVIDPEREISQKTRDNDTAEVPLRVRTHPAGIDLTLTDADVVLLPEEVTTTPMSVTVQGILRNQGLTDAGSAQLVVFDGEPSLNRRLGSVSVDVPSLGQTPFSLDVMLTEARVHVLTVVADPDRLLDDADRFNNRASRQMVLRLEPDLEIRAGGVIATPPAVPVGEPIRIDAEIWNGGTTTLGNFQVAFSYAFEASSFLIQQITIDGPLAPGESTVVGVDWTPNVGGSIPITVEADPQGVIGDLDPSDNSQTLILAIGASPLANLRVTPDSFTLVTDPPLQGQTAQITVAIENPSANDAGPFSAELWLDAIDSGVLLANEAFPGLAAGGSAALVSSWVVADAEDRLLYVLVDRAGAVEELDETDNQAFVEPDVQTLPDLAVTSGGVDVTPDFPEVGDSIHIDVKVANQGDQPSPASLLNWLSSTGTVIDSIAVPALDGHMEVTLGLDWNPGAEAGDFDLRVQVNPAGPLPEDTFPEGDYANNEASFSVAIQSGDLYVSSQIFSPNGDGVRDTTRFSFRNGAEQVRIFGPRGDLTRTLELEAGAEAVVWDGLNDRGNLARDGLYQVRVGSLETWVVLDNNLFAVTSELDQLLLTGFISPRVPGRDEERSFFTSMVRSPVVEELYVVERYHAAGTSPNDDEIMLQKWTGDELIEIGPYTVGLPLLSSNLQGTTFIAGYLDDGPFALLSYPEGTITPLNSPDEISMDPWLSPDGRWVVWVANGFDSLYIEDLQNPGSPLVFDAGPYSGNRPCGYSVDWTHNQRANVVVGARFGESYFFDISFAGTEVGNPPTVEVKGTSNYSGCGGRVPSLETGGETDKSAVGNSLREGPDTATDFDAGQFVWVASAGGGYYGAQSRTGAQRQIDSRQAGSEGAGQFGKNRGEQQNFRVVWRDGVEGSSSSSAPTVGKISSSMADAADGFQKGGYGGGNEINVLVIGLEDGGILEQGSFISENPPWDPPATSISNDGFVVAYDETAYGCYNSQLCFREDQTLEEIASHFGRQDRILIDDPTVPERLKSRLEAVAENGEGGRSETQYLLDWRSGEERELPFMLEKAVWSPTDKYLVANLDTAYFRDGLLAYFTPAANLTVRLKPRVLFGDAGVDLWVLATDRYMDHYQLEYADLNAPELIYQPIGLPSNELLYGESWGTWLPPANGTYRVRLRARDRAGNERSAWRRVLWNGDRDIANLYTESRYMSPRTSPGIKDQLIFHYSVLRPANVDFAIADENGNVVREIPVAADTVGPMTTIWNGDDSSGNPVPDGRYLLTYGAATWPIIVDNTPPEVVLSFSDTQLAVETSGTGSSDQDLWINEIFAAVRDANLEEWQYQSYGTHTLGAWSTEALGTEALERDGDVAWKVVGAHQMVGSERRIVARDLAGNETITARGHRDERLVFTDSEPPCRSRNRPCAFPERPALDEIGDGGGFLVGEDQTLSPFYDTLLVQSSVQSDLADLRLEYREVSLSGLPTGPWQSGDIEVSYDTVERIFPTLDVSFATPDRKVLVSDTLSAVYWDHPALSMVPHEVRLRASSDGGQEIISDPVLFQPEVPLLIEYLGLDETGDRFRVTNASAGVVRNIVLATREASSSGVFWQSRFTVIDRLLPSDFVEVNTGCVFVPFGNRLVRAQGSGDLGQEAVSLSTGIVDREGFSRLSGRFHRSSCAADGSSQLGRGFFGAEDASPCLPSGSWPSFWVTSGEASGVSGRVAADPTGALVERYELLVDGVPRLQVDGPFLSWDYFQDLDLSSLSEGGHTLSERFTYKDEPGLLGTCPQSFNVRIDRTPPGVQITEPDSEALLCPADLSVDVELNVNEAGTANHHIFLGDVRVDGDKACTPFSHKTSFEIEREYLVPGFLDLTARLVDQAGNSGCASIPVIVPDLPNIDLEVTPDVFSPVNSLGRPVVESIEFTTGTPGTYEVQVTNSSGDVMQTIPEDFTLGEDLLAFAWNGTDPGGLDVEDGTYRAVVTAMSSCGAEQTSVRSFQLDKTPPVVTFTAPAAGTLVGSSLEFFGSATDLHFERYVLEVLWLDGAGDWQPVDAGAEQVPGPGQSLGTWETGSNPPGEYLIRVYATDLPGNETWSDEVQVTLRPRNFIRSFMREPGLFSPNLDGVFDEVEIEYELIQDALITLSVVDGDGDVVATLAEGELQPGAATVGDSIIVLWDGTLNEGGIAADADYELVILAEDPLIPPTLESEEERLSVTVDTIPPDLDFISPLIGALSGLPLQLVGTQVELHPDGWALNLAMADGEPEPVAAGTGVFESRVLEELVGRPDGDYLSTFSAIDLAGNKAQTGITFTIDNTAPAVQIFKPSGGSVVNTVDDYLTLEGEVVEDNLTSYSWSYAPGSTPDPGDFMVIATESILPADGLVSFDWDAGALDDGPHTLLLSATDEPGRTAEARRTFTVDITPPDVAINAPAGGAIVAGDTDVLGRVDDANLSDWKLTVTLQGGSALPAIETGSSNVDGLLTSWTALPADGTYDLKLEAEDAAGNRSETEISVIVSVTPAGPPILISAEPVGRDVTLVWQAGAGPAPSGYQVYRDGEALGSVLSDTTLVDADLPDGGYVYTVTALIPNGTESEPSNALTATINLNLPLAHISVPSDGDRISDLVQIFGTAYRDTGLSVWRLWVRSAGSGTWVPIDSGSAPVLADELGQWDTALPQFPNGFYEIKLEVDDLFGNRAVAQIGVEVDNEAPVAPVLTFAAATILGGDGVTDDIHVEWSLDPTPADLAGYYLYRNSLLANAPGPVIGSQEPFLLDGNAYDDQDLPDGTYVYFVTAADTADNESAPSNESDPIVIDTRRPHAVIVDPPDGTEFEESVLLTAETPDLDVETVQFEVQADGTAIWQPLGPPLTRRPYLMDFAPATSGLYHLRAVASDALGPDPAPESISLTELDLAPPSPADLTVRVDGGDIHLTWTPVPDTHGDLAGYLVYRGSDLLTPTPLPTNQLTYDDLDLADGYYPYQITAVDQADNESATSPWRSGVVMTPTFDFDDPISELPSRTLGGFSEEYFETVELQRQTAPDTWETLASFASGDSNVRFPTFNLNQGFNTLRFRGQDSLDNRSRWSRELVLVYQLRPNVPADLTAEAAGADVTIDWTESGEPVSHGYAVSRDGTSLLDAPAAYPYDGPGGHVLSGSGGDVDDWLRVVDGDPNTSWLPDAETIAEGVVWQWTWADAKLITELDLRWGSRARRFSIDFLVEGQWLWWHFRSFTSSTRFVFNPNLAVQGVRISTAPGSFYCPSCTLAEVSLTGVDLVAPPQVDSGQAAGAYEYSVIEMNRFGQISDPAYTVALVSTDPPAAPIGLLAAAGACGEIELEWQEPASLPPVFLGYRLYRSADGTSFEAIADPAPSQLAHLDTGLGIDATFHYRLTTLGEISGLEVESAPSNVATATTECMTPPAPQLLEPTEPGMPVNWPTTHADVGGRAFPGSLLTLFRDGVDVGAVILPDSEAMSTAWLPGFDFGALSVDAAPRRVAFESDSGSEGVSVLDLLTGETWSFTGDEPRDGALDPAGERLAFIDWNGGLNIFLADLADGVTEQLTFGDDYASPRFSHDGQSLFYVGRVPFSGERQIYHRNLGSGVETVLYQTYSSPSHLAQSPDGRFLAVGFYSMGPVLIDLQTGDVEHLGDYNSMRMSATPFSPDSRALIFAQPGGNVTSARLKIVDLETLAEQEVSSADGEFAGVFLDARTIAYFEINPSDSDLFNLMTRSLFDGEQALLASNLDRFSLSSSDGGPWDLQRTAAGDLWLTQDGALQRRVQPSGSFVFPEVELQVGVNTFVARQELGDDTQGSLPIEVIVDPSAFGDAEVLSITATPGLPVTGTTVAVEGIAHNAGSARLNGLVASLVRVAPSGVSDVVISETFDLDDDESRRVRFLWDTTGQEGDYRWRLILDPADLLTELDESNNVGEIVVPLRETLGAHAAIATDRAVYELGDLAAITAEVTVNDAPAPTVARITIEDAAGNWVADVETWQDDTFGYEARTTVSGWSVLGIYPGDYQAVVTVERSGSEAARAETPFRVLAQIDAAITSTTDRPLYARGDGANLLARLSNTGDATLRDVVLHLSVTTVSSVSTPRGTEVASIQRPVAALPPGDLLPAPWALETSPIPPGNYAFTARVVDDGGAELALSTPAPFVITAAGAELQGSLAVDPVAVEPDEGPLTISATVENVGDAGLSDVVVKVDVIDPETNAVVSHLEAPATPFGAGESRPFTWDLPLEVSRLQPYLVSLTAERPALGGTTIEEPLATASFLLIDRTPPDVELLEPVTEILCSESMPVRVRAIDELSSVFRVFFHLDDSMNDLPLTRESVESEIFTSQVVIDRDRLDPYRVEVFAEDTVNNLSGGVAVDFLPTIDDEPPTVTVDGPAEGACVAAATFTWTADDLNLESVVATLDGVTYAAGDPVLGDGQHLFELLAVDGCSLSASESRSFLLDATAPAIQVTGVAAGGRYEESVTAEWTISDENLTASSATLDGVPVSSPLVIDTVGSHVLELSATDCAGTVTTVTVSFEVTALGGLNVVGLLYATHEVFVGMPIHADGQVSNQSTAELVAAEISLLLVDAKTDAIVDSFMIVETVPVEGLAFVSHVFDSLDVPAGGYRVELRVAGDFGGVPYDLELDRADVRVRAGLEIPTLDPSWLLFLAALLATAGAMLLRRRSRLELETLEMQDNPAGGARAPRSTRAPRSKKRGGRVGMIWLLAALGVFGLKTPVQAQEGAELCNGHFPGLAKMASITGTPARADEPSIALAVKSSAIARELAIEKALWQEEIRHQRQVLSRAGGEAESRIDLAESRTLEALSTLSKAIQEKASLSPAELSDLLRCGPASSASSSPISAQLAPKRDDEPVARQPSKSRGYPDDYRSAPSEAVIEATAVARRRQAERETLRANQKVDIIRPDYLADKVTELAGNPVAIYNFVLQEIRAGHYFGSIKNAEAVLRSGEGNDADQAGLLAELMRLSGFPARLVWGVQQIPTSSLLNHFEARDTPTLERVLTNAGIPWQPVIVGGQATAYLLDRVWAEVYLPYANYRGVVLDDSGATWLALDPQMKTFDPDSPSARTLDVMGFDVDEFFNGYVAGDPCTRPLEQAGACPLPSRLIEEQVDAYLGNPGDYLSATQPTALAEQKGEVLPPGMVGVAQGVDGFGLELPASLRHRVRLRARDGSRVMFDATVDVSELAGQEATLWYVPATVADETIVASYGHRLWNTPPYLVDVRLELWTDGEVLLPASEPIGMGQPFELEITLTAPDGSSTSFVNDHRAGVAAGLGFGAGAEAYAPPNGEPQNTLEVLGKMAADYLAATDSFGARLARLEGLTRVFPRPNVVSIGSIVEPQGSLGLIEALDYKSVFVDADLHSSRAIGSGATADRDAARRWLTLTQLESSARERELFEVQGMAAMSADLALALAADRGITIHRIDFSNLSTILPTLAFEDAVLDEIEGWVLAGGEALVPAEPMAFIEWTGVGYLLIDPLTGESRYQISGVLSGGMLAVPWFEVVEGTRTPLSRSHSGSVNPRGEKAVGGTIFDGNLQLATVGETLSDGGDTIAFKLEVFDDKGVPVRGAEVSFKVLTGGGSMSSERVLSDRTGLASVDFTLGTKTDESPYFLRFPEKDHSTRAGLNVVAIEVNGHPVPDLFYAIGEPDEVAEIEQPHGATLEGLPHLSVGTPVLAVPVDQYGNPISNQDVVFTLSSGPGGDDKGPELISREDKLNCIPGTVIAGECNGMTTVTDDGAVNGVWAWLVLGEDDSYSITANAKGEDGGSAEITFTGEVLKDRVPSGVFVGFPVLRVSGRGQPNGDDGAGSIEAYPPGETSVPLRVNVHVVREDFDVEACGDDACRVPLGTFKAIRLGDQPAPECLPEDCGGDTLDERVEIAFNGAGGGATVSSPDGEGLYSYSVPMPSTPGRYEVTAAPTAYVAIPLIPDDASHFGAIEPCTEDPLCGGKFEIEEVSDENWRSTYVLWTVTGQVTTPTPIVLLGHDRNHEEDTIFEYQIQPPDYPALNTHMLFIEDGTVPFLAQTEGTGDGTATLPQGEMFDHPEGDHEVMVALNVGWVWSPRADEQVSLTVMSDPVPFSVAQLDIDVDSNNDDGVEEPQRDDIEETLEQGDGEEDYGKHIFVNHDNDDYSTSNDRIPDYADMQVVGEDNLVPMMVELRPEGGDWSTAKLTFEYDGPPADNVPDNMGEDIPPGSSSAIKDFTGKKVGKLRIWRIDDAESEKAADRYLAPGDPQPASTLGFGPGNEVIRLWVEALNGTKAGEETVPVDVTVKLSYQGSEADKKIRFTPFEPNLGVNNSSNGSGGDGSSGYASIRPGVPDATWVIDEYDDMAEDQGQGFPFWHSTSGVGRLIDESTIIDLAPMQIDFPEFLLEEGYELTLELVDPTGDVDMILYPVDRSVTLGPDLPYLKSEDVVDDLVSGFFGGGVLTYSNQIKVDTRHGRFADRLPQTEPEDARQGYLFRAPSFAGPSRTVQMNLFYREPGGFDWHSVDSTLFTLKDIKQFFSMYSARDPSGPSGSEPYKTECHPEADCDANPNRLPKTGTIALYPTATHHGDTAMPDMAKKHVFMPVHGFAVSQEDALISFSKVTKRIYWLGFRGNIIGFNWEGDEGFLNYAANVENSFQSSKSFLDLVKTEVQGRLGATPGKTFVMAHSLGNQVVLDALRQHAIDQPGSQLIKKLFSVEPAVWQEVFWPEDEYSYGPAGGSGGSGIPGLFGLPATYSEDDLRCNSWAFWFDQSRHSTKDVMDELVHSYSWLDYALHAMRADDWLIRNRGHHYNREPDGDPDCWRIPVADSSGNPPLSSGVATLMKIRIFPPYGILDLLVPAGATTNPMASISVDATDHGWDARGHSDFQSSDFSEIYEWWREVPGGATMGVE